MGGGEVCTKTFISHAIYQPFALNNQPELGLMKSKTNLKICYANIDLLWKSAENIFFYAELSREDALTGSKVDMSRF